MTDPHPPGSGGTGGGSGGGSGTGSSGGGSSSSSSSGGSSSSGNAAAGAKATFQALLISWGLPVAGEMANLIAHAVGGKWNISQFEIALYQTPTFHQAFPGIFNPNGSLKMSPTQYLGVARQYQQYAQQAGIPLTQKNLVSLFKNDTSPAEAAQKFQAVQKLRDNRQMFEAWNDQRKFEHKRPLKEGEMLKFIIGEGNKDWYQDWNSANVRYAASQAGVAFAKAAEMGHGDAVLGEGQVKSIMGEGLSPGALTQHFQNLYRTLANVLPQSQLQGFGLTKDDLVQAEFGGPKQGQINQLIAQIGKNQQARQQQVGSVVSKTGQAGSRAAQMRPYA